MGNDPLRIPKVRPTWTDIPPESRRKKNTLWAARVNVLRENPGRWAKWNGYTPRTVNNYTTTLRRKWPQVEWRGVIDENNNGEIWARWRPEAKEDEHVSGD